MGIIVLVMNLTLLSFVLVLYFSSSHAARKLCENFDKYSVAMREVCGDFSDGWTYDQFKSCERNGEEICQKIPTMKPCPPKSFDKQTFEYFNRATDGDGKITLEELRDILDCQGSQK